MSEIVSIITATYNAERFIELTIQSVLKQTYENFEMIIIDDYSTDHTCDIVQRYMKLDKRIKLYKLDQNSGAAVARNYGINKAIGRYIAFLDSDDLWDRQKLEKQINYMKNHSIGFSFTASRLISEAGEELNKVVDVPTQITYKDLLGNTIIGCLTVVIDREIIGGVNMPLLRAGQDTATWLSILKKGYIAYGYNEVLASYRIVKGSISSNKFKALKRTWNIYRNVEKMSFLKSAMYFIRYVKNAIIKRM